MTLKLRSIGTVFALINMLFFLPLAYAEVRIKGNGLFSQILKAQEEKKSVAETKNACEELNTNELGLQAAKAADEAGDYAAAVKVLNLVLSRTRTLLKNSRPVPQGQFSPPCVVGRERFDNTLEATRTVLARTYEALAEHYKNGWGVPKNEKLALEYYEEAGPEALKRNAERTEIENRAIHEKNVQVMLARRAALEKDTSRLTLFGVTFGEPVESVVDCHFKLVEKKSCTFKPCRIEYVKSDTPTIEDYSCLIRPEPNSRPEPQGLFEALALAIQGRGPNSGPEPLVLSLSLRQRESFPWIFGEVAIALVNEKIEGMTMRVRIYTTAADQEVRRVLTEKFGPQTSETEEKYQNELGAVWTKPVVEWKKKGVIVQFFYEPEQFSKNGYIVVETDAYQQAKRIRYIENNKSKEKL